MSVWLRGRHGFPEGFISQNSTSTLVIAYRLDDGQATFPVSGRQSEETAVTNKVSCPAARGAVEINRRCVDFTPDIHARTLQIRRLEPVVSLTGSATPSRVLL